MAKTDSNPRPKPSLPSNPSPVRERSNNGDQGNNKGTQRPLNEGTGPRKPKG